MMKILCKVSVLSYGMLFLAGCDLLGWQSKTTDTADEDMPLTGTSWWLQSFQDEMGKTSDTGTDEIVLIFTESDTLKGKAFHKSPTGDEVWVNSYSSTFSVDHSTLKIQKVGSTEVGVPPGSRYTEYLAALEEALTYEIQGDRLLFFYGEDASKALHFKAGENVDSLE